MKHLKIFTVVLFAAFAALLNINSAVHSQTAGGGNTAAQAAASARATDEANKVSGNNVVAATAEIDNEGADPNSTANFTYDPNGRPPAAACPTPACGPHPWDDCNPMACDPEDLPPDAPAAFDNMTNGFVGQGIFEEDKDAFSKVDEIERDGLGPVYNAQSCRECHQNPVTGAITQITELRAGHKDAMGNFIDAPGGSLINDRATNSKIQERVPPLFTAGIVPKDSHTPQDPIVNEEPERTFRTALNTLGDGFVEAIANGTLLAIANNQPVVSNNQVHGQAIRVPVLETAPGDNSPPETFPGQFRIGRFGWKDQHASLFSFSGDAYLNEMGITNFLVRDENTSLGRFVGFGSGFDPIRDDRACLDGSGDTCAEDIERDINDFAEFMRATKAPPQDTDIQQDPRFSADVEAGKQLFFHMPAPNAPTFSCSICHVPAILTAMPGTSINGGELEVSPFLGRRVIHPFSDFLLHDVGTNDPIVQNGGQATSGKVRTPALWGVRTRTRLMHDGDSRTFQDAILRHQGEAALVTAAFRALSEPQKRQLITFLESL
ncbi:MAG: di-heme oxidoredictase family protein [Pyrinomonadaceae bacterium]